MDKYAWRANLHPYEFDCINLYDVSLIVEVEQEKQEFELYKVREICYWTVNSQPTKHIERDKIMILPSENAKVDLVKKYNTEYAERQLRRMMQTTQTTNQ